MNEKQPSSIFISFSQDFEFATKLQKELEARGFDVWIYTEDMTPGVDWLEYIKQNIEASDIFLFLISPNSISSDTCKSEIDYANNEKHKRIVPIIVQKVDFKTVPNIISKVQAISFETEDKFDQAFEELLKVIFTEPGWVTDHTTLLLRAKEWSDSGKAKNKLLRSDVWNFDKKIRKFDERTREEKYPPRNKRKFVGPEPTELQREYIAESKKDNFITVVKFALSTISALFIICILAVRAIYQQAQTSIQAATITEQVGIAKAGLTERVKDALTADAANTQQAYIAQVASTREAQQATLVQAERTLKAEQAVTAQAQMQGAATEIVAAQVESGVNESIARRLAAQAKNLSLEQGNTATLSGLLAVEATKRFPHLEADQAMRNFLSVAALPISSIKFEDSIQSFDFSPDGNLAVAASFDGIVQVWHVQTGQPITRLVTDSNYVAFSPNGWWLVTGDCIKREEENIFGVRVCSNYIVRVLDTTNWN